MNTEDEARKRREAFEKEQKEINDFYERRKQARKLEAAKKKERLAKQSARQNEANKQMDSLVDQNVPDSLGSGSNEATNPKPVFQLNRGIDLGPKGSSASHNKSGGSTTSERKRVAPNGAIIPGLEQAQSDRQKNQKYGITQGGRFTSNTSTGKTGIGTVTGGGSVLRKGFRF